MHIWRATSMLFSLLVLLLVLLSSSIKEAALVFRGVNMNAHRQLQ